MEPLLRGVVVKFRCSLSDISGMSKVSLFALLGLFVVAGGSVANTPSDTWPRGSGTPEGIACDLARSFIDTDLELLKATVVPPLGRGESAEEYGEFLRGMAGTIVANSEQVDLPEDWPKRINRLFAARDLSKGGPSSYGYAAWNLKKVMFVDVEVELRNGDLFIHRTQVLQLPSGKWGVMPAPHIYLLLSDGLHDEAPSELAYESSPK